jgi:hypothetical protein
MTPYKTAEFEIAPGNLRAGIKSENITAIGQPFRPKCPRTIAVAAIVEPWASLKSNAIHHGSLNELGIGRVPPNIAIDRFLPSKTYLLSGEKKSRGKGK